MPILKYVYRYQILLSVALSLFSTGQSKAQQAVDTLLAKQYFLQADSLCKISQFENSIAWYEKALSIYQQEGKWKWVAQCFNKIAGNQRELFNLQGMIAASQQALEVSTTKMKSPNAEGSQAYLGLAQASYFTGDFSSSLNQVLKALVIQHQVFDVPNESLTDIYNTLGVIYYGTGKYDSALYFMEKSLDLKISLLGEHHERVALSYQNIGAIYYHLGNLDQNLYYTLRAVKIGEQIYKNDPFALANVYSNVVGSYVMNGDHDLAEAYAQKALRLIGNEQDDIKASIYNNLGRMYMQKLGFDQALTYYFDALKIVKKVFGENHPRVALYYSNIGEAYIFKKEYDLAKRTILKAENIFQTLATDHPQLINVYSYMARLYDEQDDSENALFYLNKGVTAARKIGEKNFQLAAFYNDIGVIHYEEKKSDSALVYFGKAMAANLPIVEKGHPLTESSIMDNLEPTTLIRSLEGKAKVLTQLSKEKNDPKLLKEALQTYQLSDALLVQQRQSYQSHEDKISLSATAANVYEGAIQTSLELGTYIKDNKYLGQAFYFSEKSKAGTLQEMINNLQAKNFARLPDSLISYERALKSDRGFYRSKIIEANAQEQGFDTVMVGYYKDRLFQLNRSYDSLNQELEQNFPAYHQLKSQDLIISVDQVQKKLSSSEALLEYFWGDSSLYVFVITDHQFEVITLEKDTALQSAIASIREAWDRTDQISSSRTHENYTRCAYEIYEKVLDQPLSFLDPSVNKLIIIPDGPLSFLPFDVLLTKAETGDYRTLPYLLKEYQIRYSSDARGLLKTPSRKKAPYSSDFLAFAPAYQGWEMDSASSISLRQFRDQITALDWNQPEVKNIGNYLDGVPYLGDQALEGRFKNEAGQFGILHLAMHAFVDEENPMNSKFIFAQSDDSTEDGYLHTFEIYDMELNASLAVLSACNTGFGKLAKGEGVMSLARAFRYAGVLSVVMSHWPVNDQAGAQLIQLFYKHLKKGIPKDEALWQAKLEYLQKANHVNANPYFWGNFVLTGDPAPIQRINHKYWYWVLSVFAVLALGVGLLKYRRRKAK